ncbi:hypothetical protein [Saccharicrinis sp. 156]|uniref:hypothetical protein n=1 Tax=Saccharicrinis sp. 156 TaxID=3417574 RepID=UPI003D330C13
MSHTIGKSLTNADYRFSAGVQQAYEILLITNISTPTNEPNVKLYPNPATEYITIETPTE